MNQPNRLYSIAQEWARLREKALIETDAEKVIAIIDRIAVLLQKAEELVVFNDEDSDDADASWFDMSDEESGVQ